MRCQCHHMHGASGVIDTACQILHHMHNRRTIRTALAAFKGNIYKKYMLPNKKMFVHAVSACIIFACGYRSYLGEFEAEFKKALARESRA
jgi:hypothetical protein